MTIWVVTKPGVDDFEVLRAFYDAEAAKRYIHSLPDVETVEYDWESIELEEPAK